MAMNDAVDWATELGGETRVALIQAGTFRSDAGTLFGPVPWVLWGDLVTDEVDDKRRLLQALNCLLIETRSGRVLVETGIGTRVDEKTRTMRSYEGPWIVDALETAGFLPESIEVVAMSHLHFDHAGGLLRADGEHALNRQVWANSLVDTGMFAHSRNPLYVANLLFFLGLAIVHNGWAMYLIVLPFFMVAYCCIVAAEEEYLHGRFGEAYEDYCRRVPRWLPSLRGLSSTLRSTEFDWLKVLRKEYGTPFAWTSGLLLLLVLGALWAESLRRRSAASSSRDHRDLDRARDRVSDCEDAQVERPPRHDLIKAHAQCPRPNESCTPRHARVTLPDDDHGIAAAAELVHREPRRAAVPRRARRRALPRAVHGRRRHLHPRPGARRPRHRHRRRRAASTPTSAA